MNPLNIGIVFGTDETKARVTHTHMTLQHEKALNGWGARKAPVMIHGKPYVVEVFVIRHCEDLPEETVKSKQKEMFS